MDYTLRRVLVRSIIGLAQTDIVSWQLVNVEETPGCTTIEFEGLRPYHMMPDGSTQKVVKRFRVVVDELTQESGSEFVHTTEPKNEYGDVNRVCHCQRTETHKTHPYRKTER